MENSKFPGDITTEGNIDISKLIVGGDYRISEPLKYVGFLKLGDIQISTTIRPKWFHKVMMKLLLGIWWIENEK